jgi:hypothetical protein
MFASVVMDIHNQQKITKNNDVHMIAKNAFGKHVYSNL